MCDGKRKVKGGRQASRQREKGRKESKYTHSFMDSLVTRRRCETHDDGELVGASQRETEIRDSLIDRH